MKLYLSPTDHQITNGIGQVVEAQRRHLPDYGIELVDDPASADLKAAHIWSPLIDNDVLHNHGLEWDGDREGYAPWHGQVNQAILETAKRAWAITVPSEWVAMPFKRDMRLSPQVIGHGLFLGDWTPLPVAGRKEYLLWNKNRADLVCSPDDAVELARRGLPVVSTFGNPQVMQVTGMVPWGQMKELVRNAGVYLSTARETFGIGTLEALACGVPVLGYAYGGNLDLVQHKHNGYLVEPGDVNGLEAGYHWLMEHREEMQPAIAASVEHRDWKEIIGRYAQLYEEVWERKSKPRKVSVVITNYNYADYVGQAIKSALAQTMPVEVIVVDDSSGPESHAVLEGYRVGNEGVNVIYNSANLGVSESRNRGVGAASGRYVVCLDADDWIEPGYIETLFKAMEADQGLGIAYTGLKLHFESGESSVSPWPPQFDFEKMAKPGLPPPNCISCAAMFRRDMWERAGGYRQEYAPGEDVEFWLRGLSVGFNARRVTDQPLFNYRMHRGSASRTRQYVPIDGDKPWTRDKNLMPIAAPTKQPNLVRSYSEPLVSVIIPVGPRHFKYVNRAIDSLLAQTFKNWEVVLIKDFIPENLDFTLQEFLSSELYTKKPFVRALETPGVKGAGYARNMGIRAAKAPLLFFLDADDWLLPTALEKMVRAYTQNKRAFVYSDWLAVGKEPAIDKNLDPAQKEQLLAQRQLDQRQLREETGIRLSGQGQYIEKMPCQSYDQEAVRQKIQHAVSILVETEAVRKVGGFDEELATWEDWDFFIKLAAHGYCGVRVSEPLLVYQTETGTRRLKAFEPGSTIYQQIVDKWKDVNFMPCCGQSAKIERAAFDALAYPSQSSDVPDGRVRLIYVGPAQASFKVLGKYEVANDGINNKVDALPEEVNQLLQFGTFVEA